MAMTAPTNKGIHFTVIFQRARDDKKTAGPGRSGIPPAFRNAHGGGYGSIKSGNRYQYAREASPKKVKKKWFLCGSCRF